MALVEPVAAAAAADAADPVDSGAPTAVVAAFAELEIEGMESPPLTPGVVTTVVAPPVTVDAAGADPEETARAVIEVDLTVEVLTVEVVFLDVVEVFLVEVVAAAATSTNDAASATQARTFGPNNILLLDVFEQGKRMEIDRNNFSFRRVTYKYIYTK